MKKPTFQEQYQKIVDAYYKEELEPWNGCACFVGNLLNKKDTWCNARYVEIGEMQTNSPILEEVLTFVNKESNGLYSYQEVINLEQNFLNIAYNRKNSLWFVKGNQTEDSLFAAMESTLQMLRKIHESKGEVVKDYNFTKRELTY